MHLADAFTQSDLHCIQGINFITSCISNSFFLLWNNIQFNDIFRWSTSLNDGSLSNNFNYTSITHKQVFFGDNKQPFKQTDSLKWIELFDLQTQEKKTTKWGLSSLMDKEGHTSLEWAFLGEASL